ncbi:glycosyltransferase [Terriglobus aquaticus]|uniref:Glycosyltransferase n=1 Tax=Terriglobus aquaticus TaxID=940139 RepID=A0ABW9KMS3_9BACT|nr:glycosyltransferase [Terriglobus aquaticus]
MRREAGGPAEGLRLLLRGYCRDGHEAEVATLDPPSMQVEDVCARTHTLGRKTFGYGYSSALSDFFRQEAARFDGVVIHGLWQYQGLAALRELRGRHRYAVFPHGMLDPWFNRMYPLKMIKKLPYWFLVERDLLRGADAVLFTSSAEAQLARTSFPGSQWRAEVVPYGTLGPQGDPGRNHQAFLERVPALRGRPFLLYAGRMHEKKGCDLLLSAYAELRHKLDLPCLLMAGPDETGLTGTLQAMAARRGVQDDVLWPGMLTGDAKWGAFAAADAFVLPSHQENFGIAVAEALSCGTPVLISDQVNIHGDISASDAGLVEPDTLDGVQRLLRRWSAMTDSERKDMRGKALQCWRNRFDSAGTSRAIARLFQERRAAAAEGPPPGVPDRRRA